VCSVTDPADRAGSKIETTQGSDLSAVVGVFVEGIDWNPPFWTRGAIENKVFRGVVIGCDGSVRK